MGKSGYFYKQGYCYADILNIPTGDSARFMECYFYIFDTSYSQVILRYGTNADYMGLSYYSFNNKVYILFRGTYTSTTEILNGWNHVGIGYTGTALYMYLNGSIVKSIEGISTVYSTNYSRFYIGGILNSPSVDFGGLIDNVRVYNRCLSLAEFNKSHRVTNGLLAAYNFNNDDGITMYDTLGNYNGVYYNASIDTNNSIDFDRYVLRHLDNSNNQYVSGGSTTPITLNTIDSLVTQSPNNYLPFIQTGDRILRII